MLSVGGTNLIWASMWFVFALVCSAVGLVFAVDGHTYKKGVKEQQKNDIVDISKDQLTNAEIQC